MRPPARALLAAAALALVTSACSGGTVTTGGTPVATPPGPSANPTPDAGPTVRPPTTGSTTTAAPGPVTPADVTTVATDLQVPWGLAFLPGGDALVAERDSALVKRVTRDGAVSTVGKVPGVAPNGEGGLLGLAVDRDVAQDRWLYAYLTTDQDNRVVRMRYSPDGLGPPQVLLSGIAAANHHDGGRLRFGPDGMLYVGTGDAGDTSRSQDPSSLNGKILRIAPDGSIPADNPTAGSPVWSLGHRNVQGLAFDDAGRLWASEFGQQQVDELNVIRKGANYGWPEVEGTGGGDRYVDPVAQWSPTSTASPSGIAWVRDTVFVGALAGQCLYVVPVDGTSAGEPQTALSDLGRIRTVEPAPDGSIWVTTSNTDGRASPRSGDDRILRVTLRAAG